MALKSDALLERRPGVSLVIDSSNLVHFEVDGRRFTSGPRALAILDAFYRPITLHDAVSALGHLDDSAEAWMNLTRTIVGMVKVGILREAGADPTLEVQDEGYGGLGVHRRMLNDRARTDAYLRAIREVVRPGDVVVDIGTGTGVLAIAAVQAGAAKVYALEASGSSALAEEVARANDVADRVEVVRGWSQHLTLPEKADVLVSEMIGDEPLGEQILEITLDARKRFLKTDARLIPRSLRLFAVPVEMPGDEFRARSVSTASVETWRSWYGIDFTPLVARRSDVTELTYVPSHKVGEWVRGAPVVLADLDLAAYSELFVDATRTVSFTGDATVNGVLGYFDCALSPSVALSTAPDEADPDNHWMSPLWSLPEPLEFRGGETLEISYAYRVPGKPHGVRARALGP